MKKLQNTSFEIEDIKKPRNGNYKTENYSKKKIYRIGSIVQLQRIDSVTQDRATDLPNLKRE